MDDREQRIRIKIACEECRKIKRKCDGGQPVCSACDKSHKMCIYDAMGSRKRQLEDSDQLNELKDRIVMLENQLHAEKINNASMHTQLLLTEPPAFREMKYSASTPYQNIEQGFHGPARDLLQNPSSRLSVAAVEELAFMTQAMKVEDFGEPSFTAVIPRTSRAATLTDYNLSHSPKDIILLRDRNELIDCFFATFNKFHQVISEEEVQQISREEKGGELDQHFRNSALLAIGACYSSHSQAEYFKAHYRTLAEESILRCIKERPGHLVIQGLIMLAWIELMFGAQRMAYNYIAMATGQVFHIGLHVTALVDIRGQCETNLAMYQQRVRTFWAYFSVDRLISSALGMNCTLHWQRIRTGPFLQVLLREHSLEEIAHDALCQSWRLWDICMDSTYAFNWASLSHKTRTFIVQRSHRLFAEFYDRIDPRLRSTPTTGTPDCIIWFQAHYHATLILIHRPLLQSAADPAASQFSLCTMTTAAAAISQLLRNGRRNWTLAPQILHCIHASAVIHLLNATSGRAKLGRQSANGLKSCMDVLTEMQPRWRLPVETSIQRIRELASRWKVVWALPMRYSEPLVGESKDSTHGTEKFNGNWAQDDRIAKENSREAERGPTESGLDTEFGHEVEGVWDIFNDPLTWDWFNSNTTSLGY